MLLALRIENFTVVEEVEVGFGPGLTVLTGETGAGKSILVDALGLLLGTRADADCVRTGADEAVVEAVFQRTAGARPRGSRRWACRTTGTRWCSGGWSAAPGGARCTSTARWPRSACSAS